MRILGEFGAGKITLWYNIPVQYIIYTLLSERRESRIMNYCFPKNTNFNKRLNYPFRKLLIIYGIILAVFIVTPLTVASDLDDFEEAATADYSDKNPDDKDDDKKEEKKDDTKTMLYDEEEEDDDRNLFDLLIFALYSNLDAKIAITLARVKEPTEISAKEFDFRQTGEPTLPFIHLEQKNIRVNSDISALDYDFELGYGPYAFKYRHTSFEEKNPRDEMDLIQYLLFIRLSPASTWEYGIGLGSLRLQGNEDNSGFMIYLPLKIYPYKSFGFQFKPTLSWINDNVIGDYDLSLAFSKRYYSIKLGYRFLRVRNEDLDGAYIGLTFDY